MIKLICSYPYDNKYDYSKTFTSKVDQTTYFNSFEKIVINPYNEDNEQGYIKDNESFCVEENYDYLVSLGVNYVIFNNGYKDIFAFITSKEYLSDDTTRLNYEIDVVQTFMFDFTVSNSFIERKVCTIDEVSDYDEGLNIGEHIIVSDTTVITKDALYFAMFTGIKDFKVTLDANYKITSYVELPVGQDKPSTKIDGINYPLHFVPLTSGVIPSFIVDHPSLVGIVRFPSCTYTTQQIKIPFLTKVIDAFGSGTVDYMTVDYLVNSATTITSETHNGSGGSVAKTDITDFFPYTYYVLTDGESDPLIMKPQELPSSINVVGKYALSHQPIERFYVTGYKGDSSGKVYNITNTNQMMLPTAKNEGMAYISANGASLKMQRDNAVMNNVLNAVGTVAGAVATNGASLLGGGIQSTVAGINQVREADQRNKSMMLTPNSIASYGTPSTRINFGTNSVRVLKYSVSDAIKAKIQNFVLRYGNKFNNYDVIDIKSYKGYIKFISPDIDSKIDNMYINTIIQILERGIYFE